jgi:hypothetical protein
MFMNPKKQHLIPPNSPLLAQYDYLVEAMTDPTRNTLVLSTDPEVVESLDVDTLIEIIAVAEHFPIVLNKLLFAIEIQFRRVAGGEAYLQPGEWKASKGHYRWFRQVGEALPFSFFFLQDYEARFYCITGDYLYEGEVDIREEEGRTRPLISFSESQSQAILYRVFFGCVYFMHYCYGTEVDPQPAIEAAIAEFDMDFSFEQVSKEYRAQMDQGMVFRLGPDTEE